MEFVELKPETLDLLDGEDNQFRDYFITLGQSESSKGVMFVLYSVLKKCTSAHVNPCNYLGQLSNNLEDAVISARKKVGKFKIQIEQEETMNLRKQHGVIGFGKYRGKTIEEIFDIDYKYVYWLANKSYFGELKINKKLQSTLNEYYSISKELIVEENRQKSKPALLIDKEKVERTLICYKIKDSYYGLVQRFKDTEGNIFQYSGKRLVDKEGDTITLNCKVTKSFESLGYVFNKINLR
jgi:uncharacterized protein (DUF3820 family)